MGSVALEGRLIDETRHERVRAAYERDHARLWRSLYAFSGSRPIADEACAEAFAQALRRGNDIHDVSAWVWRSAYAIARGELRRRSAMEVLGSSQDTPVEPDGLTRVLASLAELPERDRELLVLCHVAGWKPGELSRVLGVPSGVLRVRLHRATRRARALLEDER